MSQAVTVYRWDDPGAPQMPDGKPSEILNVLMKCLVEGYGSKSPLGWTRPFHDAGVQASVFRNNIAAGGSGGFVKFYSSTGSDTANLAMRMTHAASMTGINDFFRQGYTQTFLAQTGTPGPTGTKRDKWVLIGTAIGFYFLISAASVTMNSSTNYLPTMYVGDFYSAIASDTSKFIAVVSVIDADDLTAPGSGDTLDSLGTVSSTATACLKIYDADNFEAFKQYSFRPLITETLITNSTDYSAIPATEHLLLPVLIWYTSQSMNTSPPLKDRLNVLINDSIVSPLIRGVLPGLNFSLKMGYRGATWPQTKTIGGKNHWLMRSQTGSGSACSGWLNMEEWNDPFGIV
jgi:hypothetical protein